MSNNICLTTLSASKVLSSFPKNHKIPAPIAFRPIFA